MSKGRSSTNVSCIIWIVVVILLGSIAYRLFGPTDAYTIYFDSKLNWWDILKDITVIYLIPVGTILVLILILTTASGIAEVITAVILFLTLGFYYAEYLQGLLPEFNYQYLQVVTDFPIIYRDFILRIIPESEGFSLFGYQFFSYQITEKFVPTFWPLIVLILGVAIWTVLNKYVKNERLKNVGREYWLFITAYIIVVYIFSEIGNLSFIRIMLISFTVVFIFAAGLFRVGKDVGNLFLTIFRISYRFFRIGLKYVALIAARFTKILRNLVKFMRDIYEKYILRPFRKLYEKIQGFLNKIEKRVNQLLEEEELE